jgi:antitoxin component of RelBE/YafQ-DinJ toxin-antitoxin module
MSSNPYRDHYSSEGQTQVSARIDDDLKADIKQLAEDRDLTQGDLIEETLAKAVADAGMIDAGNVIDPDDPIERDLYQTLIETVETGKFVGLKPVRSIIAQECQVPSDKIPMWIERLMDKGYSQIRSAAPGQHNTTYAFAVKPPENEPFGWQPEDFDADPDEVTNADENLGKLIDDAEPIIDDDEDPITDEEEIDSDDDHILGFDVTVETETDETDDGEIISDGGIRLVDYYRGLYQLENGQPIRINDIDLPDSKLKEIADQGWISIDRDYIYCRVVPQDQIRIDDRNFETLGQKKQEHFRREGMSYDSYLRNQKNLSPDPTRLVIDQTTDNDDATKVAADGGSDQ